MKKPHGDRPVVEPAATDHASVQQFRYWIRAYGLQAHRGCTGFRIDELGLADLISSPDPDLKPRQGRTDGSGLSFAPRLNWR
jgi:hypothetical protein